MSESKVTVTYQVTVQVKMDPAHYTRNGSGLIPTFLECAADNAQCVSDDFGGLDEYLVPMDANQVHVKAISVTPGWA